MPPIKFEVSGVEVERLGVGDWGVKEEAASTSSHFDEGGSGMGDGPDPPAASASPGPIRTVPLVNGVPTPGGVLAPPSPTNPDADPHRPPLRLTLKLPLLLTRKAALLGTAERPLTVHIGIFRAGVRKKTRAVEAANEIVARRRGRPPKRHPPAPLGLNAASSPTTTFLPPTPSQAQDAAKVEHLRGEARR